MAFTSSSNPRFSVVSDTLRPASKLRNTIRSLHLQAFWELTKWRSTAEAPKTTLYKSRRVVGLQALLHLVPLVICIGLITCNIADYAISWNAPSNTSAIQFAAKMLEIFMQASITSMVLHHVRNAILGRNPLPFGALVGPYRTTDVSYLWSLELWGALTSPGFRGWQRIATTVLLPSAVALAALVGPSAAVLMIPRPFSKHAWNVLTFINQTSIVYPKVVSLDGYQIQSERDFNQTVNQIVNGLSGGLAAPIVDQSGPRSLSLNRLRPSNITMLVDDNVFTTKGATIPNRLSSYASLIGSANLYPLMKATQPYLQTQCWVETFVPVPDPQNTHVRFGPSATELNKLVTYKDLIDSMTNVTDEDGSESWQLQLNGTNYSFLWHDITDETANHSVIATFGMTDDTYANWTTWACTADAYWTVASSNTTRSGNAAITIANEDPSDVLPRVVATDLMRISASWASRVTKLTMDYIFQDPVSNTNIFGALDGFEEVSGMHVFTPATYFFTPVMALALSAVPPVDGMMFDFASTEGTFGLLEKHTNNLYLTTYLDLQQSNSVAAYVGQQKYLDHFDQIMFPGHTTNWTDPASLATIEKRMYEHVYGYTNEGTAVCLSLAVLFVYVLGVIAHLITSLITGTTATSWSSVTELFALALNSERPDLNNISVGIDTLETFRKTMSVRVNSEESAEIVFASNSSGDSDDGKQQ